MNEVQASPLALGRVPVLCPSPNPQVIRHLGILLTPYTPDLSSKILDAIGVPPGEEFRNLAALDPAKGPLAQGTSIPKPTPLVPRIEVEAEA